MPGALSASEGRYECLKGPSERLKGLPERLKEPMDKLNILLKFRNDHFKARKELSLSVGRNPLDARMAPESCNGHCALDEPSQCLKGASEREYQSGA